MSYASNTVFGEGDSLGLYWPEYFERHVASVDKNVTGSAQLIAHMEPDIVANWAARRSTTDVAVLQGGINDIKTASADIADMKTAMTSMISAVSGAGISVFVINLSPWKNHTDWTAGRQTQTDDWNTWLAAQQVGQGFTLIDTYAAMEDPGNADELLPAYDVGDGLHFNAAGARAQTAIVQTVLLAAGVLNLVTSMNTNKLWRGAVQPPEAGTTGNLNSRWRGAVEPAGVAETTRNILAITRRTLDRPPTKRIYPKPRTSMRDLQ